VGFEIALVDQVKPKLVGELQQQRVRRIVRGANRVDVEALHELQLVDDRLGRNGATEVGMVLVSVHAAKQDARPVHLELGILDSDRSEANPQSHGLQRGHDLDRVEPRRFRRPRFDDAEIDGRTGLAVGQSELGKRHDRRLHRTLGFDAQQAVAVGGEVGVHEDIPNRARGRTQQRDIAEDAGKPPHVLVFDVARC